VAAMFANESGRYEHLFFRGPSIDASYQVSIHLQTWPPQAILISDCSIKKKFSSETALPNELKLRRKHLWKVLYKDCTFVHLAKRFQRRRLKLFFNRPIRNKNCLWRPCLLMNRADMSTFYREPSVWPN
jgi:hypothetical protein